MRHLRHRASGEEPRNLGIFRRVVDTVSNIDRKMSTPHQRKPRVADLTSIFLSPDRSERLAAAHREASYREDPIVLGSGRISKALRAAQNGELSNCTARERHLSIGLYPDLPSGGRGCNDNRAAAHLTTMASATVTARPTDSRRCSDSRNHSMWRCIADRQLRLECRSLNNGLVRLRAKLSPSAKEAQSNILKGCLWRSACKTAGRRFLSF
jgi:hypothetical protein